MFRIPVLLTAFIAFINLQQAQAKILRVGYLGTPVAGIDFPTFDNTVIAAAVAGDTIQIYQNNSTSGGSPTITKRLVIIGYGYMLDKNPGLQTISAADNATYLYFNPGSEGTIVQGINIYQAYIAVNNITITRCRISYGVYLGLNATNSQQPAISNINIFSNFFGSYYLSDYGQVSNLFLSNNIFYGMSIQLDNSSGIFTNNIMSSSSITLNSFVIRNNISSSCINSSGSIFQNNLFSSTSCSSIAGNGNVFGVNMNNIFLNWNGGSISADNQLQLKAGSPALNAGINGNGDPTDAGVFGGDPGFTYRLSGIPAVPSIYQLTAPSQTASNNPYTITVSVRSNN